MCLQGGDERNIERFITNKSFKKIEDELKIIGSHRVTVYAQ